jgi:NAD+ synthase
LGYFTRFGDAASDLEPIQHLFKSQVIELAKSLGIPQSIIEKPPSADLWHGQTDEAELGFTYADADPILMLIDQHKTKEEIVKQGFDPSLTETIFSKVEAAAFKHKVPYTL